MRKGLVVVIVLSASFCLAQQTCDQIVPQLMEVAGVNDTLSSFPELAKQSAEAELAKQPELPAADKDVIVSAAIRGIDEQRLHSNVSKFLIQNCTSGTFATVLQQLQAPLPQKMRTYEAYTQNPQGVTEMRQYLSTLQDHPPAQARIQLLQELVSETKGADFLTDMIVASSSAIASGLTGKEPSSQELAQLRSQVSASAANQMLAMSVFTYRNAPEDELSQYVAMYKAAPFQQFDDALSKAFVQGFSEELRHVGEELRKAVDAKQPTKPSAKS